MAQFPIKGVGVGQLSRNDSPSKYEPLLEVNDKRADAEGGYEFRRRRFTRKPRNTIKMGFLNITHADKLILEAFYDTMLTDTAFIWYDQIAGINRQVYFEKSPVWNYEGIGPLKLWSPNFELKEV